MAHYAICPYCQAYVTEIQPGDMSRSYMEHRVREYQDISRHDWMCLGCGWLWSDESVKQATKDYYDKETS